MKVTEAVLLPEAKALEALISRLPATHSYQEFLEVELHRTSAGKRGEEKLLKKLVEFELNGHHLVIPDINLTKGALKIQIDSLLVTESQAIIIESKNINGKIHFDGTTGEFYRYDREGIKTVMEDPVIQLQRNMRFIREWLKSKNLNLAVKGLVVFTSKECEFISKPQNVPICKTYQLHEYLYNMLGTIPLESTVNPKKVKKLIERHQTPYKRIPLCTYYRIDPALLAKGVRCGGCRRFGRGTIKKAGWSCNNCGQIDATAIHNTLNEYFTLISHSISNTELRNFFLLDSRHAASRILVKYGMDRSGERKTRKYSIKIPN